MNTKVAFFRVEGVLLKPGVLPLAMYLTVNSAGLRERVLRTGAVALFSPVYQVLKSKDRQTVNRLLYQCFQGMGEDRVRYLLEEYFEDCLQDKVLERGKTFLRSAQEAGFQTVLLSEQLQGLVALLVEKLAPVDHFLGNRLEFKNGQATGRLVEPIIGGYQGGRWLQQWSQEQGFDLKHSRAYASQSTDLLFLANVGEACAVNPDFSLRRAALEADWPIVDYC